MVVLVGLIGSFDQLITLIFLLNVKPILKRMQRVIAFLAVAPHLVSTYFLSLFHERLVVALAVRPCLRLVAYLGASLFVL